MIYALMGPDDFSIREWLEELKKTLGDESLLSLNTARLEGRSLTPGELRGACETVPFMAEKRLVIVTGLLERYEPPQRSPRAKARRTAFNESECRAFGAGINAVPDTTVLLLIDAKVGSSNPLFKLVSAAAQMKSFPSLKDDRLKQWITKRAATEGGTISPLAVNLLSRLIGGDLWIMASEVKKLVLLTAGRRIEEADVRAAVGYAQETTVFALIDAIMEFKAGTSGRLLEQLKQEGVASPQVLAMIARQARLLVLVRELKNQGCSTAEMLTRLGVKDFVVRKTMDIASRYSLSRVKEVYRKLLEADVATKTGHYDGDLALNILIAELCAAGGQTSPA